VELAKKEGYQRIVSLTRNPRLKSIYCSVGFEEKTPEDLQHRKSKSPDVPMFIYLL